MYKAWPSRLDCSLDMATLYESRYSSDPLWVHNNPKRKFHPTSWDHINDFQFAAIDNGIQLASYTFWCIENIHSRGKIGRMHDPSSRTSCNHQVSALETLLTQDASSRIQ